MSARRLPLALAMLLSAPLAAHALDDQKKPALTAEDKKYLGGLMKQFLFDPTPTEVQQTNQNGEVLKRVKHPKKTSQAWIASVP